ncbi:Arachidonate--CoA ligase [Aphelenchoides bicaudatus]|nr:Arachidonate--CoA ligase [Aphelenchoides bicaudatus]
MVKESLWVLPINVGGRLADLASLSDSITSSPSTLASITVGGAAAMGLYWLWNSKSEGKINPLVDLNSQTRILSDGSRVCKYLRSNNLVRTLHHEVTTLYEAVRRGARNSNNGEMLGYRDSTQEGKPYTWIKYNDVINRSVDLAHAFQALGLDAGQATRVGIYCKNRPEWVMIEQATYVFNNIIVPLYDTLGPDACTYIINQAEIRLVVCDDLSKVKGLLKHREACPSLQYLVVMEDSLLGEDVAQAKEQGVQLMTFAELEKIGRAEPRKAHQPPKPDDLATLCFTSGTTGVPKGVMLTHGNVIADSSTLDYFKNVELSTGDVMMSFLPLAHMFERVVQCVVYTEGGRVGFFSGNIKTLADDIKTLQPTVLPVVPRVLNRMYDKVMHEVNKSKLKKALFEAGLKYKMAQLKNCIIRNDSWVDQIVFKKIRDSMGGRLKLMITGSAPCAENVLNFVRCAMGCTVVEGYGQTEAVACVSISLEGDAVPGHVGVPSPCNAVKLVDVPELGYYSKDNAGEICVRGANVFRGYFKNEAETKAVLDEDGWLHTGDVGRWTDRGTLRIVDRKKHIFKLAQGEYVAPEKIENIYARSKFVAQSFIHGESLKTCLIAIVVPDPEVLPGVAAEKLNLATDLSMEELCDREDVKQMIVKDLLDVGKAAGLYSFEQVKDIYLSAEQFSVENGLLTPTLKSKRPQLKLHYKKQLDAMYSVLE